MSQQSKCDRCSAVGDATSGAFGTVMIPEGWARLQVWTAAMEIALDLCGKCYGEAVAGGGLELPLKKAEAAAEALYGNVDVVGGHFHPPHGPHPGRRPWPPRRP